MKRLLVVLLVAVACSGANWEGAEWHTIYSEDSFSIAGLQGLTCSGDTTYIIAYTDNFHGRMIKWSPDERVEAVPTPFEVQSVYGFSHADSLKRFPALLYGPTLWRLGELGWDSTRIAPNNATMCFAVGPDGAIHYLLNDSLSEGVIYRRIGGGRPDLDTVVTPCIQMRYVGHWIGVDDQNNVTCAIEEDFQSGEDLWIPCMKAVRYDAGGVESEEFGWHTWNRRYLQGFDGRWFVVRDLCDGGLVAEVFHNLSLQFSVDILRYDYRFRLAQNPVDSLFEVAGMPLDGPFNCEIVREQPGLEWWEGPQVFESPATVPAFHFMIDQFGYGHLFVADSNTIYRYGPPPRISDAEPRAQLPKELSLSVYPNPGNAEFRLSYSLTKASDVVLKLFDVSGREVATLVDANREAGEHVLNWNASAQASGVYFAMLEAGDARRVTKLVLMK